MKNLLFAFLLIGLLSGAARCDIVVPPPPNLKVANLAAFPGFKFSYTTDYGNPNHNFTPLRERQSIGNHVFRLFVEDGVGERVEWASVEGGHGKVTTISVQDVHRDGKTIKVTFKMQSEPLGGGKSSQNSPSPGVLFAMSGFSLGAVVFLMRRKRAASTGA